MSHADDLHDMAADFEHDRRKEERMMRELDLITPFGKASIKQDGTGDYTTLASAIAGESGKNKTRRLQ